MRPSNLAGMSIPLVDLTAQYQRIKPEINAAIQRVLDRGQFILGPEVSALEEELAAYCGVAHGVAVASGTDALELSLRALGIGPGDEVLTTAFSFVAMAEAIVAVGGVPVFVDIDPRAYTIDPSLIEAKISPRTKVVLPVHLYGQPCDMDAIMRIAQRHRLQVLEDAAQAIGARYEGRRVGSFGVAGCVSFYPSKNLGAYGDGGIVLTNDPHLAEQIRLLRAHGSRERYHHLILGTNSRLDEVQAAVLRVKLRYLDQWNEARRRAAGLYTGELKQRRLPHLVVLEERPGCESVYHLYTIRLTSKRRDRVRECLTQQGISTQVAYPGTLPAQPAFASFVNRSDTCPEAERAAQEVLSIPMYPELSREAIARVIDAIAQALTAA